MLMLVILALIAFLGWKANAVKLEYLAAVVGVAAIAGFLLPIMVSGFAGGSISLVAYSTLIVRLVVQSSIAFVAGVGIHRTWDFLSSRLRSSGKATFPQPSLRPCPYCAEDIKREAIKCRFCGSAVDAWAAKE